jgi:DNA-binding beta-propeller fold protein YncE
VRPVVVALLVLTGAMLTATPAGAVTGYAVTAAIPVGPGSLELGVDPSLSRLYVSTADGLDVVDTTTRRVLTQVPASPPGPSRSTCQLTACMSPTPDRAR